MCSTASSMSPSLVPVQLYEKKEVALPTRSSTPAWLPPTSTMLSASERPVQRVTAHMPRGSLDRGAEGELRVLVHVRDSSMHAVGVYFWTDLESLRALW